jgi:hypothetical protein
MIATQDELNQERCRRCAGPMYLASEGECCCLYCGEYVFLSAPRKRGNRPRPGAARTSQSREAVEFAASA